MKVRQLTQRLQEYNPEAEISVVAHCKKYPFSLSFGGPDGVTKKNADEVSFYVDQLCTNEKPKSGLMDIIPEIPLSEPPDGWIITKSDDSVVMFDKLPRKFKVGDNIKVCGDLNTIVESIKWDKQNQTWKYYFFDEDKVRWSENENAIEFLDEPTL